MAQGTLLFLSDTGLVIYRLALARPLRVAAFADNEGGRSEFADWLKSSRPGVCQVLVDISEEDFHTDSVPFLRGRDRSAVIRRKLDQLYRCKARYSSATSLGRDAGGRRDERILFTALQRADWLDAWLDILDAELVPVSGITSTSILGRRLAKRADLVSERLSIISYHPDAGLRQTFFDSRGLKLSRLIPVDEEARKDLPNQVYSESHRAQQYLVSLRLMSRQDRLDVLAICAPEDIPRYQTICRDEGGMYFHFVTPAQMALRLGWKDTAADLNAQELLVALALKQVPPNAYALPARRRYYRLWLVGRVLGAASIMVAFAGAMGVSWLSLHTEELRGQVVLLQKQVARANQDMALHQKAIDQLKLSTDDVDAVVKLYRQVIKPWPSLGPGIQQLGRVFDRHPSIKLLQLDWEVMAQSPLPPLAASAASATAATPVVMVSSNTESAHLGRFLSITIHGRVEPFNENYRLVLGQLQDFRADLASWQQSRAEWSSLPVDVRPSGSIDEPDPPKEAPFVLTWVIPLPDDSTAVPGASHG